MLLRRAKSPNLYGQFQYWVLGLAQLFQAVIIVMSFGLLTTDVYTDLLFSDFMEND